MKFTTFDQVEKEFKNKSNGSNILKLSPVRFSELSEHKEDIEYLLGTEYNTVSGFTFYELMEAVSTVISNNAVEYTNDNRNNGGMLNESFLATTQAQAPFPVLNRGLVMYQYEKSVLPYLAHVFDLKANRGLAYYMELRAQNSPLGSGVNKGDKIASPIEMSKQTKNFISTKVTNAVVGTLEVGTDTYNIHLGATAADANGKVKIMPQSLTITVDGLAPAFLVDKSNDVDGTSIYLTNEMGAIGNAVVDINTGIMTLVLFNAPTQVGSIRATFNRDVETVEGANNQAVVAPQLKAVQLQAEDFSVFAETNLHQQRLAQVIFGMDWNAEVDNLLGACYNREIANKVLSDIVSKIPGQSVHTYDITSSIGAGSGDNRYFNTAYLPVPFNMVSKMISKATGLTGLNKVSTYAINVDALPVIQNLPKFKAIETGENFMGGMALVGTYDNIPVIQAYEPILNGSASGAEVVGIYKSKEKEFLSAAVVGQFILPIVRDVYDQNNLAINKKQLISSAATETVVPQLAAKLVITGIDTLA